MGLFSVIPLIPEHVVHSPSSCTGPFGGFSLCIHATAPMFQSTQTKAQSRCKSSLQCTIKESHRNINAYICSQKNTISIK